jgi:hypothetical protein
MDMRLYADHCAVREKPVHILFVDRSRGGLGLHLMTIPQDSLHCLDLGPSLIINGSVLWLLCYTTMVRDGQPEAALEQVFLKIDDIYKRDRTPTRLTNLSLGMFVDMKSPLDCTIELGCKAAESRHLVPVLREVWDSYADPVRVFDQHVGAVLKELTGVYSVIDWKTETGHCPQFLAPGLSVKLRDHIDAFLTHMTLLEQIALDRDRPLNIFHRTSKCHSLWHLGFESQFLHPAAAKTYGNEDWMGKMVKVGNSSRHAIVPEARSDAVAATYALGKSVTLAICDGQL